MGFSIFLYAEKLDSFGAVLIITVFSGIKDILSNKFFFSIKKWKVVLNTKLCILKMKLHWTIITVVGDALHIMKFNAYFL